MKINKEYETITELKGPLIIVENVEHAGFGELVKIKGDKGESLGQVLETQKGYTVVQVFNGTFGLGRKTRVRFTGDVMKFGVSNEMQGRIFNGLGEPIDGGLKPNPDEMLEISGNIINPVSRNLPKKFIQTGISTIDVMNTLVRGQKLPVFSGNGLPHNKLAAQIARQAKVNDNENFKIVFCAIGITSEESKFFIHEFEKTGALENSLLFLNLANDPSIERLMTPRVALTAAEYLAYEHNNQVLVILTDMTNYCEALREVSAAREEIPGRQGYPGYMYTDLASLYERAGRIKGKKGSVTQMPFLTMPNDDITHPIPDLTGYVTEGQLVLSRSFYRRGIYPPINPLPSLSRMMKNGIGEGSTREDHFDVSNQLYSFYAEGMELRSLVSLVGESALSEQNKKLLKFASSFEEKFVRQSFYEDRQIEKSLDIAWDLLSDVSEIELKQIPLNIVKKYKKVKQ